MTDLPVPLHEWAARTLVGSRVTYARYLQLLEAQRAALRADDIDLLAGNDTAHEDRLAVKPPDPVRPVDESGYLQAMRRVVHRE